MDSAEILRANKHGENLNKRVLCGEKLLAVFTYSSAALPPLLYQQIFSCLNALKPQRNVRLSAFCMGAFGKKKKEKKMCRLVQLLFPQLEEQPSSIEGRRGLRVKPCTHWLIRGSF